MSVNRKYPRTPPRLSVVYPDHPLYFVTLCTHERAAMLAKDDVLDAFTEFARRGHEEQGIAVGKFVIMPDHMHLFVRGPHGFRLSRWVSLLKACITKAIRPRYHPIVWQRGFFDHVLRTGESYHEKWEYVAQNPVRKRYVAKVEQWPFAGEIVPIDRA